MKRPSRLWCTTLLLLSRCGGEAAPPADATVDARDVSAPPADASLEASVDAPPRPDAPVDSAPAPLVWTRCRTSFTCAEVSLPMDPSRPDGPRFSLGLLRARARRPEQRVGVLMVNYGGPGSSTSEGVALRYPNVLGSAVGDTIADRYDIVAVDWRGHGTSRPAIACSFVDNTDPEAAPSVDPRDDASWNAFVSAQRRTRDACVASVPRELLARVGADDMARDMDRVRELLGEERITYVGYSYGAYLGGVYLTLFPSRVRAVVLDAPPAPQRSLRELTLGQMQGFHNAFQRFFAWCAVDPRCTLPGRAEGASGVERAFADLVNQLDRSPLAVGLRRATGETALAALFSASYAPEDSWVTAASVLSLAARGEGRSLRAYVDANLADDQFLSSYFAVRALDNAPSPEETPESFRAFLLREGAAVDPLLVRAFGDGVTFVQWPVARANPRPTISAPTAPPALLVSARHDAPTPYAGALQMREALGNGSHLLTYEGGRHASSTRVPCVAEVVLGFLSDPTTPPRRDSCPEVSF